MRIIGHLALACGLFVLSCGGDSDDGSDGGGGSGGGTPGVVDTGLPEETPLEDVTAEQYANACESLREDVRARLGPDIAVRGVCEVYGAAFSDTTSECSNAADTCETRVNGGGFSVAGFSINRADLDFTSFECNDVGDLDGCSVTVGEFETCLEDQMSGLEALMAENNCANAADVDLTQAAALADLGSMAPPSCARVQQECPGVGPFGDL
ncbi:MAG TPA: hypothetical protein VMG12_30985 [Polyangiaceae bacterium]|nr:hypothetical protein [Polyangiaceae bacterium]